MDDICRNACDLLVEYDHFVKKTARTEYDEIGTVVRLADTREVVHLPIYASLGLAGETGEFVELIKKWARDPFGARPPQQKIKSELGDIVWYVTRIAHQSGLTIEEIIQYNMEKLTERQLHGKKEGQ